VETIQEVRDDIGNINTTIILLLSGVACGMVICIGFTYWQITRNRIAARRINEVITEIGSAEGGLNLRGGLVNITVRPGPGL